MCVNTEALERHDFFEMRDAASAFDMTSLYHPRIEPVHVIQFVAAVGEVDQ